MNKATLPLLCAWSLLFGLSRLDAADGQPVAEPRAVLDLSGEWEFKADPSDIGKSEHWFENTTSYDRKIRVPGAWNSQGVTFSSDTLLDAYEKGRLEEHKQLYGMGTLGKERESAKLFSPFPGPAWYRTRCTIPATWTGKVPWLVFGGVHREAEVWVNGVFVGAHRSYLTPFRIDLSAYAKAGDSINISARVDARRKREIDPLMGCFDTLDFLYITWGGIHRPVSLEATESTRLDEIFVIPHMPSRTAEIRVSLKGAKRAHLAAAAEILDSKGKSVATAQRDAERDALETALPLVISNPVSWSPKTPYLYTARVRLLLDGQVLDERSVRFGMREFKAAEGKFLLNGQPIFLRGYGDDCIFPNTLCPRADKAELSRRLSAAREFGFNFVRHHSWIPTEEYLDAADELGMMLQPEFPFAYRWDLPVTAAAKQAALEQWEAIIRLHRNHPSIVAWCMGNELYDSFDLAPGMFKIAKGLDPTRPVIDTDGCGFKHKDRTTLDYMVVQFGEGDSIGFQSPKYTVPAGLKKPVLAHEMGYFVTLPDLNQLDLFRDGLRPYWLIQARDLASQNGILARYPEWLSYSYRLQATCLKCNMEAARRSPLSGTSVWLFQDYPNCAEGVVDMFFKPKALTPDEFRTFNAPTVLLVDLPRRNWRAGEGIDFKFLVSRFEEEASVAALSWKLQSGADTLASGVQDHIQVRPDGLQELPPLHVEAPSRAHAEQLTLSVQLQDAAGTVSNSWKVWIFPTDVLTETARQIRTDGLDELQKRYSWIKPWQPKSEPGAPDLLVTTRLGADARAYLQAGGRVFLIEPAPIFAVEKTNFRLSSWDGGGPSGTILDPTHPALRDMPSEGWCDLQFYSLIQGSKTVFLNPLGAKVQPLVRCIDRPTRLADRAYLFEVSVGQGKLLVSSFNFHSALDGKDPGAVFFLDRLIRYALTDEFRPSVSLPADSLAGHATK